MPYQKQKQFAVKISKQAGKELLKFFNQTQRLKFTKKSKHEIVTPADMASNKIILNGIKKHFPKHGILSEETGYFQKNSDYLWTVDPLDGTTNFAMGSPLWGICLGLFYKKELVLGVINLPYLKELFWAIKNQGAFIIQSPESKIQRVNVAKIKKLSNSLITYCYGYADKSIRFGNKISLILREKAIDARQLGSAAVETAWLAKGKSQGFLVQSANLWDVAPGAIIIREAKGKVTDLQGRYWNINSKSFLASNGLIHKELLNVVSRIDKK